MSRSWSASSVQYTKGTYWNLRSGRDQDRLNLSIGYVTPEEARRAAERLTLEEKLGRGSRIREWHAEDREAAIRYLLGDPELDALIQGQPDYARMPLRQYFDEVYKPWRSESTPAGWRWEARVWTQVLAAIGDRELRAIDAHVVADHLDGLVAQRGARVGQPLSGNAKRLHRAAIAALLKRAFRLKHLAALPDLAVFQIKGASKRVVTKPDPLSLEELVALMDVSEPKLRAMWAVGGGQGMRPSELMRVHWEDVDLTKRVLDVRGTKTDASIARVPMTGLTRRELSVWWEACGEPAEGLVFPSSTGEAYSEQGYRNQLKAAAKRAGIGRRVYPYLLRDSFATIAWGLGVDMDIARRILRHTDDAMLREVYCRPRPEDIARFVETFDYR